MFKLIFFLCSGLFLAMLVAGQDHGQQRFGLIAKAPEPVAEMAPPVEATAIAAAPETAVIAAAFAPEKPVMTAPATDPATEAAAPAEPTGRILYIDAKSVNVRSGPGKDFDILDRLQRDEAVLVVSEGEGPDGWSLIRIEGDGVEGYVAARLLRE